jgi:predicted deacylase
MSHSSCDMPEIEVIRGEQPGPRIGVLGGVHGNEYCGVLAARQFVDIIRRGSFRGEVRVAAPAHPGAWAARTRLCPVDGMNLARVFPGDPAGSPTERVAAHLVDRLIRQSDLVVDLHTAGAWSDMPMLAGYHADGTAVSEMAKQAVAAFAAPYTWEHPTISPGRSLSAAEAFDVPSFYVESAGSGRVLMEQQQAYVEGLLRVMAHLGMRDDAPRPMERSVVVRSAGDTDPGGLERDGMVVAPSAGYFVQVLGVGGRVREAEALGELQDERGRSLGTVLSPRSGVVMMVRTESPVAQHDSLAIVAQIVD